MKKHKKTKPQEHMEPEMEPAGEMKKAGEDTEPAQEPAGEPEAMEASHHAGTELEAKREHEEAVEALNEKQTEDSQGEEVSMRREGRAVAKKSAKKGSAKAMKAKKPGGMERKGSSKARGAKR